MTVSLPRSICNAIRGRNYLRIEHEDNGVDCADFIEPYVLGYDHSDRLILRGYSWARHPRPKNYLTGIHTYLVERITRAYVNHETFEQPREPYDPRGGPEFKRVICDLLVSGDFPESDV
jgi:hypothetical protein